MFSVVRLFVALLFSFSFFFEVRSSASYVECVCKLLVATCAVFTWHLLFDCTLTHYDSHQGMDCGHFATRDRFLLKICFWDLRACQNLTEKTKQKNNCSGEYKERTKVARYDIRQQRPFELALSRAKVTTTEGSVPP